jgi:predicted dehydrogenase
VEAGPLTVTVALLGASAIAEKHARNLLVLPKVAVRGVHSRSLGRARDFAARLGIEVATDDLEVLLGDTGIDAVVVASEPDRHVELASRALAAGKHVLLEKPLDCDLGRARAFAAETEAFPGVVSVVSQKRFDPVLLDMKGRLEGAGPALVHLGMMWRRDGAYYRHGSGWRADGSDFFLNHAIHWLDVLNWFFGEPAEVRAFSLAGREGIGSKDRGVGILCYDDGTMASLYGGTFCGKPHVDRFTVFLKGESIDYQDLRAAGAASGRLGRLFASPPAASDPLAPQVEDFVAAIREKRPPRTTVGDALKALELAKALS